MSLTLDTQQRLVVWIAALASFVAFLDGTVVNVALPAISEELGGGLVTQQWVVDAYSLVFAGMLFTAGTLGDRFGRKGFMQAGIVLFGLGSAYTTFFGDTAASVIGARAAMGVDRAAIWA